MKSAYRYSSSFILSSFNFRLAIDSAEWYSIVVSSHHPARGRQGPALPNAWQLHGRQCERAWSNNDQMMKSDDDQQADDEQWWQVIMVAELPCRARWRHIILHMIHIELNSIFNSYHVWIHIVFKSYFKNKVSETKSNIKTNTYVYYIAHVSYLIQDKLHWILHAIPINSILFSKYYLNN